MTDQFSKHLLPDRQAFAADPFGYAALAWQRWAMLQALAGFRVDPEQAPTAQDLKSPVLWLCHARALSEAASAVLRHEPAFEQQPRQATGICDSQYCAVGLMLVGYSLEVCLKAMLIIRSGVDAYAAEERTYKHHRLEELASFIPDLTEKDRAILRLLTQFLIWAGRYPDPGSGRLSNAENIFSVSEEHQISARDLFVLSTRVISQTSIEIERAA